MRSSVVLILLALAASACTKPPEERRFTLHGQIVAIGSTRQEATIKHDEIKGLMPAMTMPYKVQETKLLDGVTPGDLVDATLVIVPNDAYLIEIRKAGRAPLEQPPAEAPPAASSGVEVLKPGERVPDAVFLDQDGRRRNFGSRLRGSGLWLSLPWPWQL